MDSHLPEDSTTPGEQVNWKVELASNVSSSGGKSVLLYIDGPRDDVTLWIERKLTLEQNNALV